jgi:Cu/Ag efflux protein CusF
MLDPSRPTTRLAPGLLVCAILLAAPVAAQDARKSYSFSGTVQRVDAAARTLTVQGEAVSGWMSAMSMLYRVDKPDSSPN